MKAVKLKQAVMPEEGQKSRAPLDGRAAHAFREARPDEVEHVVPIEVKLATGTAASWSRVSPSTCWCQVATKISWKKDSDPTSNSRNSSMRVLPRMSGDGSSRRAMLEDFETVY